LLRLCPCASRARPPATRRLVRLRRATEDEIIAGRDTRIPTFRTPGNANFRRCRTFASAATRLAIVSDHGGDFQRPQCHPIGERPRPTKDPWSNSDAATIIWNKASIACVFRPFVME
jgi:hypothetical protein